MTMPTILSDLRSLTWQSLLGEVDGVLYFTASIADHEGTALVSIVKKAFTVDILKQLLSAHTELFSLDEHNDVYYQYSARCEATLQELKVKIVFPASEAEIAKYTAQSLVMIRESAKDYETTINEFDSRRYNILEHKKEADTIVLEDSHPQEGFIILPDFKWDKSDVSKLYLLGISQRRDIRSVRDLRQIHLPMLRNMREKALRGIEGKFKLAPNRIRAYVHYQPSFYHFHVHFVQVGLATTNAVGKAILLDDIIDNLEREDDFYAHASLTFVVGEREALYFKFYPS